MFLRIFSRIILLRHKRDIESAIPLSPPEINSMLKVNAYIAICQRTIMPLEDCFINNKLRWSIQIVKGRSFSEDSRYMYKQ